jgi:class 3 adenylate cyclase
MNRTFERLLDVSYAAGGGLLKFGGDALLLFFTGGEHAEHACDAAYGMRKALRTESQLRGEPHRRSPRARAG